MLTAVARDGSGNIATSPNVVVTVTNTTQPPGLVAAYGFDQGSGSSAPDASGTGNCGTLTNGATWSRSGAENAGLTRRSMNELDVMPGRGGMDGLEDAGRARRVSPADWPASRAGVTAESVASHTRPSRSDVAGRRSA
jgi:hypothetical protein